MPHAGDDCYATGFLRKLCILKVDQNRLLQLPATIGQLVLFYFLIYCFIVRLSYLLCCKFSVAS